MKLIDDDYVEAIRLQLLESVFGEALDHGEDVLANGNSPAAMNLAK